MFSVYKITNSKNEYYISYSPHRLPFVLHKKLCAFYAKKEWHSCFLIFENDANELSISEIAVCNTEKESVFKINEYMHEHANCVNYRQNPNDFI